MYEKLVFWFYTAAIRVGLIRFDQWIEDDADGMKHIAIEPKWFWQSRKGEWV